MENVSAEPRRHETKLDVRFGERRRNRGLGLTIMIEARRSFVAELELGLGRLRRSFVGSSLEVARGG